MGERSCDRVSRPHAVVDALFIRYEDMPRQKALAVVGRITNDLRRGVPWPKVYKQYSEEFSYPPDPKTGDSTKIGLRGPLVIFPDSALGRGHMATVTFLVRSVGGSMAGDATTAPSMGFGVLRSCTSSDASEGQCR